MMTRRVRLRRATAAVVAGAALLLGSCSDGFKMRKTYPVSGQVKVDGKPLKGVSIALHPDDKTMERERPLGETDENGKFTLTTYYTGDGAPEGGFTVCLAVVPTGDDGSDQQKRVFNPIPEKYGKAETSDLKVTIKAGGNELPAFEITGVKPRR
jgi:serine/threonine-protein phosphatase CPPED1